MSPLRVGVVGCGNISPIYLKNLSSSPHTQVVAVSDLDAEKAAARAAEHGIPKTCPTEQLLADPGVDLVLNLTVPKAHYEVSRKALEAGKHVYVEKPLAVELPEGKELVALAESKGLVIGCAPDTVLGAGIQTCRSLVDAGEIGQLVGAQAFMQCPGHESWHPSPEFYYEKGGGPLFDMGPYYLSALVTLLGPIEKVTAFAKASFPTRTITSEPKAGKVVPVETPTHIVTALEFGCGALGQLTTSFDVQASTLPCIQLYGSEGTIQVPDPNGFGGPVLIWTKATREWTEVELRHAYAENGRGIGVVDIAVALREGRACRASGSLALHVLEVMAASLHSAEFGEAVNVRHQVLQPVPMPQEGFE